MSLWTSLTVRYNHMMMVMMEARKESVKVAVNELADEIVK